MALEFELINILDNSHNDKNIADNVNKQFNFDEQYVN